MNATLRIEPHMPNTLEVFIPQAIALAQQLLVHVAFDWNGVNVTVLRSSDAEAVIAAVRRAMISGNDVIGECEARRAVP